MCVCVVCLFCTHRNNAKSIVIFPSVHLELYVCVYLHNIYLEIISDWLCFITRYYIDVIFDFAKLYTYELLLNINRILGIMWPAKVAILTK